MTRRVRRRTALSALQIVLGVVAIAWLALQADWGRILSLLLGVPRLVLLAILVVTLGEFLARFSVWYVLLRAVGTAGFGAAANIDLVIRFVNHLLPSRVSGRSVSPIVVRHYTGYAWSESVALAGANTGMYALLYGVVSAAGLVVGLDYFGFGVELLLGLSTGVYLAVAVVVAVAGYRIGGFEGSDGLEAAVGRIPYVGTRAADAMEVLPDFTDDTSRVFRSLYGDPGIWVPYGLGWAGKLMVFPGIRVGLLLSSLGAGFEPAWLLPVVLVTAYSITILPLTPGGIGVTEATATVVFVAFGVPYEVIIPVILIDRFLGVYLPALLGGVPMLDLDLSDVTSD